MTLVEKPRAVPQPAFRPRLLTLLKVHPSEARLAFLVSLFFALIELGRGMGASAADALFFLRFGVEFLPYLYIALGVATFVVSLSFAALLGSMAKRRLFTLLLSGMAAAILLERVALPLEVRQLYPLLWLSINLIASLLGTLAWAIASEACDTRQAKRLYPLFVSAGILGGLLGSLSIGPIARLLGTENLLVIYTLLLLVAMALAGDIAAHHFRSPGQAGKSASFLSDLRAGFDTVRNSALLQRLAVAAVLFSVLYFSISFPFGKIVAASFADEAELAGFLGLFNGVASALMFLTALLVANRLYARIGIARALLILPVTYLLAFVLLAVHFTLPRAMLARLAQLVVLSGIGDGAYSTFFNVVPLEKRAQVRAFDAGVPAQLGTILSGLLLILGERVLNNIQIFLMGMAVAGLCAYVVWQMGPSYVQALLAALRAGRLEVFTTGERIFAGFQQDANAIRLVSAALEDPRPSTQQVAAEMAVRMGMRHTAPKLVRLLPQVEREVRVSFLRALADLGDKKAATPVSACLSDPAPEVRRAAIQSLSKLYPPGDPGLRQNVEPMLSDVDFAVRVQAIASLAIHEQDESAAARLGDLLQDRSDGRRIVVLRALEAMHGEGLLVEPHNREALQEGVGACLKDNSAAVREAACQVLPWLDSEAGIRMLVRQLCDPEPEVQLAAAQALKTTVPRSIPYTLAALQDPCVEPLSALEALPANDPALAGALRSYAQVEVERLRRWRKLHKDLPVVGRVTGYLSTVLEARSARSEQRLVKVLGLLGHAEAMRLAAERLHVADAQARSAALETLDVLGDKQLVKALLPLMEDSSGSSALHQEPGGAFEQVFAHLSTQADRWLQALVIAAAGELAMRNLTPDLHQYADAPDPLINQAARAALVQLGEKMETLATMSLLERVLFLKEVPLFGDLSPDDLGQLAELAKERWFSDGEILCREGEQGDELFIITAGCVRVTRQDGSHAKLLATRCVGEFLGEMSIIDATPRSASVAAVGEVRTLVITSPAFKAILRERPEVSLAVMRGLSRRLREKEM